jgi:hypothetical protein
MSVTDGSRARKARASRGHSRSSSRPRSADRVNEMRFPSPSANLRGQAYLAATALAFRDVTVRSGISFSRGKLLEAAEVEVRYARVISSERGIAKFRWSVGALALESPDIRTKSVRQASSSKAITHGSRIQREPVARAGESRPLMLVIS